MTRGFAFLVVLSIGCSAEARPSPSPSPPAPQTPAQPRSQGTLEVALDSDVRVDGVSVEPLPSRPRLMPGDHSVDVAWSGVPFVVGKRVDGSEGVVAVELPRVDVVVDGVDRFPSGVILPFSAGPHDVEIRAADAGVGHAATSTKLHLDVEAQRHTTVLVSLVEGQLQTRVLSNPPALAWNGIAFAFARDGSFRIRLDHKNDGGHADLRLCRSIGECRSVGGATWTGDWRVTVRRGETLTLRVDGRADAVHAPALYDKVPVGSPLAQTDDVR
jgi:hypothetical protein